MIREGFSYIEKKDEMIKRKGGEQECQKIKKDIP